MTNYNSLTLADSMFYLSSIPYQAILVLRVKKSILRSAVQKTDEANDKVQAAQRQAEVAYSKVLAEVNQCLEDLSIPSLPYHQNEILRSFGY